MKDLACFIAGFATFDFVLSQIVMLFGTGPKESQYHRSGLLMLSSITMYLFAIFLVMLGA